MYILGFVYLAQIWLGLGQVNGCSFFWVYMVEKQECIFGWPCSCDGKCIVLGHQPALVNLEDKALWRLLLMQPFLPIAGIVSMSVLSGRRTNKNLMPVVNQLSWKKQGCRAEDVHISESYFLYFKCRFLDHTKRDIKGGFSHIRIFITICLLFPCMLKQLCAKKDAVGLHMCQ